MIKKRKQIKEMKEWIDDLEGYNFLLVDYIVNYLKQLNLLGDFLGYLKKDSKPFFEAFECIMKNLKID